MNAAASPGWLQYGPMTLLTHADYIRKIRADIPAQAFRPAPAKLLRMLVCLVLICGAYVAFRFSPPLPVRIGLSVFIGHTLVCLAFLTHELAHGSIVRARGPRYGLEYFLWALLFVPATVWRRVHNHTHHTHASTPRDPDRAFMASEESAWTRFYTRLFYPNRDGPAWNPMVALHWIPYVIRNIVAVFWPSSLPFCFAPAKPRYTHRQRWAVASELAGIGAVQAGVFWMVGADWVNYLWAGPGAYLVTSAVAMTYVFTNHFLNPLIPESDPVLGTTSLVVPPVLDRIHTNFSLHTEHHLFPGMNSDYYAVVSESLRKNFPERYNRIGLFAAWKHLWKNEKFMPGIGGADGKTG